MKRILLRLIWFYQQAISPYKGRSYCNYVPTCSEYAKEAIEMYGVAKGSQLAARRLLRCNPFTKGGYDPVPIIWGQNINDTRVKRCNHDCACTKSWLTLGPKQT